MEEKEVVSLLKKLIFLSAVNAAELLQITENTSAILKKGEVPAKCLKAHQKIREEIVKIVKEVVPDEAGSLEKHLGFH